MTDQYDADMLRQSIADEASERMEDQGMTPDEREAHKEYMLELNFDLIREYFDTHEL